MNSKAVSIDANFGQLYQLHHDKILNSMTAKVRDRNQAEDVTSAAFTKAYQHFDGFRGDASFSTWVHAIASNAVISSHRGQQRQRTQQLSEELTGPNNVTDHLDRSEDHARLHNALTRVPERYRKGPGPSLRSRDLSQANRQAGADSGRNRPQPHLHGEAPASTSLGAWRVRGLYKATMLGEGFAGQPGRPRRRWEISHLIRKPVCPEGLQSALPFTTVRS